MIMEFLTELLAAVLGVVIGYLLHRPEAKDVIERVRIVHVDKPVVVEKLKVERVEVPMIVHRPTIQVEKVPYETVIEREVVKFVDKPTVQIERVPVPTALAKPAPPTKVNVVYMDAHERKVTHTDVIDSRLRRPTIMRGEQKYQCVKQNDEGAWVYRAIAH
jgi:hypothetical protein